MITNTMFETETDDAALVAESLAGNREAFGSIVRRYQSLICALAYNATGSLSQSEDLAQETFLTAWRQLRGLREPSKLRSWLCRIARNLSYDALKQQGREPVEAAEPLEAAEDAHSREQAPSERVMSLEEEAILWRSLEHLPGACREPLILFYREHRSIESVAASLELSEDAVKQRLSRGRKLLAEQVLAYVEGALERTGPSPAFAHSVLLALPTTSVTATATALTSASVKGSATAKAAAAGLFTAVWSAMLFIFGNYAGYRASLASTSSEDEKHYIKSFYARLAIAVIGFSIALSLLIWWGEAHSQSHRELFKILVLALATGYVVTFFGLGYWAWRNRRAAWRSQSDDSSKAIPPVFEYRSSMTFLGQPLIHIRMGGSMGRKDQVVKAWIAAGGFAIGRLFAFGGLAIAPISIGGCAIGLLSWGGTSLGMLAVGGLAPGRVVVGCNGHWLEVIWSLRGGMEGGSGRIGARARFCRRSHRARRRVRGRRRVLCFGGRFFPMG